MIQLGKSQLLTVIKKVDFGVYLADTSEENFEEKKILLPAKQVPEGTELSDKIKVFVYKDSMDRLIATTRTPAFEVGELALLKVKQTNKMGAFLDWGLEKDLLLPFKEQTTLVGEGDECLVKLYVDKSKRLCASMKVYHQLSCESPYRKDDQVEGIIYEISEQFGAFVAVDNKYSALIPKSEPVSQLRVGKRIQARVAEVKPDGKLTLSIREKAYLQMNTDAEKLLQVLEDAGGILPIGDKSAPEKIRNLTGMSKNEFKRAAGNLYKQRKITISADEMKRIEK